MVFPLGLLRNRGKPTLHLSQFSLTPVSCYYQIMPKRIPPEVLEYLRKLGQAYGSQGGTKAAKNMTAEERKARAKKAATAAARKRTAARLARERAEAAKNSRKR